MKMSKNGDLETSKWKILIFGGTGYIGRYIVKASLHFGHPTYVYSRPCSPKTDLLHEFVSLGVIVIKGEIEEHEKLVSVMRGVDVVICALAYPQVLDQLKIIEAAKVAGNIKRFLPSDFGCEEDRVTVLPPFEAFLDKKRQIRRAIKEHRIPYTFVTGSCFGAYFVNYLLHPHQKSDDVLVFGTGEAKVVLNYEEDIGKYTIEVETDPRTCNKVVVYWPKSNVISQLQLISLWEEKTGRRFNKVYVSEKQLIAQSQTLPHPQNIPVSILHAIFVKGVLMNFDLGENELEASTLYQDLEFTTVDQLLDIFITQPPEPVLAAFE